MELTPQEKIFGDFKDAASEKGIYPLTHLSADRKYQSKFNEWLRVISNHRTPIDDDLYNVAWIFSRLVHPASKRYNLKRQASTLIIAANSTTGRLGIIEKQESISYLQSSKFYTPEYIQKAVKSSRAGENRGHFGHIRSFLEGMQVKLTLKAAGYFESAHTDAGTPKKFRSGLNHLATEIAKDAMAHQQNIALEEIERIIKRPLLTFAEGLFSSGTERLKKDYTPLQLYNFLTEAQDEQSALYRQGALKVMSPMGQLYLDSAELWQLIDNGTPIFDALGQVFKCTPFTAKQIIKQAPLFSFQNQFNTWAKDLDNIDKSLWPKTVEESSFFFMLGSVVNANTEVFQREKKDVYKRWIQDSKNRGSFSWRDIFTFEMRHQITDELSKRTDNRKTIIQKRLSGNSTYELSKDDINYFQEFCRRSIENYKNSTANVKHMQNDVNLRLVRPAILLSAKEQNLPAMSKADQEGIEQKLRKIIWGGAPPSDQIAASSYWHSPRVNFSQRFQSIAAAPDKDLMWVGLFPASIEVGKLTLFPLQSRADLQEEADAMHHCVWSYSDRCLAKSYHIFSVRSNEGSRHSTLTVQDYTDEMGARQIRFIEHWAHKNKPPSKEAKKAEAELIDSVNAGLLRPDWKSIDASKAAHQARLIQNSVGYDYENDKLRDEMIGLYLPCLPRAISKKSHSFDAFKQAVQIDRLVAEFHKAISNDNNAGTAALTIPPPAQHPQP